MNNFESEEFKENGRCGHCGNWLGQIFKLLTSGEVICPSCFDKPAQPDTNK